MEFVFTTSLKRLVYLILVPLAVWIVQRFISSSQTYWLVWAALLMSLITVGDSFKRRITMIIITGLASAFAVYIAGVLSTSAPILGIYIFIVTTICVYIGQLFSRFFLQAFIVNLLVVLSAGLSVSWSENADKLLLISLGMMIAVILQLVFYPHFIRNELRSYLLITLRSLKKLNKEIFACFLEPEYSDNIYLYERRIHIQKNRFLHAMDRLREISKLAENKMTAEEKTAHRLLLTRLDTLFDNMLNYSQLRRRVTDYTTFSVCSQELNAISQEINKSFEGVMAHVAGKKFYPNTQMLARKINRLEENYHNVLQVASREPLVFMLFIDSLNAFNQNIEALYQAGLPLVNQYA